LQTLRVLRWKLLRPHLHDPRQKAADRHRFASDPGSRRARVEVSAIRIRSRVALQAWKLRHFSGIQGQIAALLVGGEGRFARRNFPVAQPPRRNVVSPGPRLPALTPWRLLACEETPPIQGLKPAFGGSFRPIRRTPRCARSLLRAGSIRRTPHCARSWLRAGSIPRTPRCARSWLRAGSAVLSCYKTTSPIFKWACRGHPSCRYAGDTVVVISVGTGCAP